MSTDTKYQVMGELLGIHAAAIEMAEEQAGRIIGIVQGGWTKEAIDECAFPPGFAESLKVQPVEFTTEDLSHLKDRGHTWIEIAAEAGITPDAARKRVGKRRAKQKEPAHYPEKDIKELIEACAELIEPGAEEARREFEAAIANQKSGRVTESAEATIRKSLTVEEFIQERIAAGDLDIDILQAVKRNFPGISMDVADIRSRR